MSVEPQDANFVYYDIVEYFNTTGGRESEWYAGITSDLDSRLFGDHNVSLEHDSYVFRKCHNADDARDVEKKLLELGFDGGPSGGDESTVYVYAYPKTAHSNP